MINESPMNMENYNDLIDLFNELDYKYQRRVGLSAMRSSAQLILKAAKQNFKSSTKGFSSNSYKDIMSSFKIKGLKKEVGQIVGIEGYSKKKGNYGVFKAVWLERGTKDRKYTTKNGVERSTGAIEGSHFFERAVEANKSQALESVSRNLIKSMEKLVKKYDKK